METLRTITSFAGKVLADGQRKYDYKTPQVLTADNGNLYILLVFGATIDSEGILHSETTRAWYAPKATMLAVVPGNRMMVAPIDNEEEEED